MTSRHIPGAARPRRRRDSGQALLVVALVLFLLMLALALVDEALVARLHATQEEARQVELEALADAAMAEALARLAADAAYRGASPHALARGAIASRIVWVSAGRFEVTATATLGGRARALRAEVDLPWGRPLVTSWRVVGAPEVE